jgi:hypothetical protein
MYVWASVAHLATPLGQMGVSALPDEHATVVALSTSLGEHSGFFLFPWHMDAKNAPPSATGPSGLVVYRPHTPTTLQPSQLGIEFGTELAECILAAILLSWTAIAGYWSRVGFVGLVGITAALTTNVSYWNWYGFPTSYTLGYSAIEVIGYFAAGLAIASLVPRRAAP